MWGTLIALLALGALTACANVDTHDEASGEIEGLGGSEISLDSGGTFVVPLDRRHLLNDLDEDQGVTIIYQEQNGQKVVKDIVPVE